MFRELAAVGKGVKEVEQWLEERSYRLTGDELSRVASVLGEELRDEDLDAVSGGGSGDSMTLQLSMDRRSRYLSTMSNIMGADGDTAGTLIDNIK